MFKLQAFTTALNFQARLPQANLKSVLTNSFYLDLLVLVDPTSYVGFPACTGAAIMSMNHPFELVLFQ